MHTTFARRQEEPQKAILAKLAQRSSFVAVLTPEAASYAEQRLGVARNRLFEVPHGVPHVDYLPPSTRGHPPSRLRLASIGYLRPDKGIDQSILALSIVKKLGHDFEYVIAGGPQPQVSNQQAYANGLPQLVDELGLSDRVCFRREFISLADQIRTLQAADLGLFAYQSPCQSSSGAIPLALACGRPVLCTPFAYSCEKRDEVGEAVFLTDGFTAEDIARSLVEVFKTPERLIECGKTAWQHARGWQWSKVADAYFNASLEAAKKPPLNSITSRARTLGRSLWGLRSRLSKVGS